MKALTQLLGVVSFDHDEDSRSKRLRLTFANGYTASIIQGSYTYGGAAGLFEIAVVHDEGIVYDTPITGDVLGYIHPEEVPDICMQIAALPPRSTEGA